MATAKVIIAGQNNIGSAVKSAQQLLGFGQAAEKIGGTLKKAFTVTAIVAAAKKLGDAASACLSDFLQAQRAYKQLCLTLKDDSAYKAVTANIAKLSRQTLSSKDEIEGMVSELAALGKSADEINSISDAAVYLSNVTGKDLTSSMTTLLNTFNGNVTQLKKLGVDTSDLTKKELEQGAAVQLVIDKFGSLSQEMAQADTSQHIQNIKNNIGDIRQSFGDLIDFSFGPLLAKLDEFTTKFKADFDDFIQRTKVVFENFPEIISRLGEALKSSFSKLFSIDGITQFVSNITTYILSKIQLVGNAAANLLSLIQGITSSALEGIGNYAMYWITHICDSLGINLSETINSIGNWLLDSPIGQVVDQLVSKAVNGIRLVGNIIKNIPQIVKIVVKNIGTMISSLFSNIPVAIKEIFLGIFDWVAYAVVSIKNNFIQSIEDAIQSIGSKLHNSWIGKLFGVGGKLETIDLGVDRTSERELYSKTNTHFENVGAAFTNIGNDLAPMVKEIEALLNPAFEKFSADNALTIGKAMATWTAKSSDDYYKAAKKNFSSIGDFLKDWGQTFLGDLDEDWNQLSSSFSTIFSDAFGEDFDAFVSWFKPFIEEKLSMKQTTTSGSGATTTENGNTGTSNGDFWNGVLGAFTSKMGEAGEVVSRLTTNMATLGPMFGAILTAIEYIFEGLSETLGPILEDFVKFGIEPLRELGRIIGELLIPVIQILMPLIEKTAAFLVTIFNALGVVLLPIIEIIGTVLTPVVSFLSSVLEALMPVIKVFAKVVVTITGTIQYVVQVLQHWIATIMNWLAGLNILGWHPFGGLRMNDPGSPGSYGSFIQSKWDSIDAAFEKGTSTVSDWKAQSNTMNTSTATSVSSAGYQGATQVTINIYQEAPVVGDGGMRQFARMIRDTFTELNYYGVTT